MVSARAASLREQGRDIISLGVGEPDFDTPEHVKAAARDAIDAGDTKYTVVSGTTSLREAIVGKLERENSLSYSVDDILVSSGAKQSVYNLVMACLDEGDEAIVPAPYWVSYPDMVRLAGAEPVIIDTGIEDGFKVTPTQLEAAITERTRLLMLNSPSNPTGACYSRAELTALGEVLAAHPGIIIMSDDIYERIYWDAEPFCNIAMACPELKGRTVVVNGVSKSYAMTGWRIGYTAAPPQLTGAMKTVQSQSTTCAPSMSQAAAAVALSGDQSFVDDMVVAFKRRHDFVVERLNRGNGIRCLEAQGAFYAFPDVRGAIAALDGVDDDIALAEYLLEKAEVAVVPGTAFGAPGYIRLSFATGDDTLHRALDRIDSALST